jgi:hypothetical protein
MSVQTTDGDRFLPELNNGGRWHHIASERELKRIHTDKEAEVYEVPPLCLTLLVSRRYMSIVRATAFGGDTRDIEGGWVYDNPLGFVADRSEILELWNSMGGFGRNKGGETKAE